MAGAEIELPNSVVNTEDQLPRTPQSMTPGSNETDNADGDKADDPGPTTKGWRFWATFPALCLTSMLAAVESTVTSTALPSITKALDAGDLYVWFANSYFLTSTVFLPLIGQLADIFGRRHVMIGVVAVFTLGSGISGGANSPAMLIAGRAIQGIGGGGINLMIEVIVSDLVPLRERGNYMALIFAIFCLGTAIGPFVGGALVERSSWRWVFYINLPIGGCSLVLLFLFLRVNFDRTTSFATRLKRIDYIGTIILVASVTSLLIALSWGGGRFPWSSWHVIVPLVLGILGLGVFHAYETAPWVKYPTLPEQAFKKRTPAAALLIAFFSFILLYWGLFFLPVYFQAVLGASPIQSGVWLLPTVLVEVPFSVIGGILLSKTGRYRPVHIVAFVLITLGFGLFAHFGPSTGKAEWVIVQMVPAIGLGFMMSTNLTGVQVDLPEKDVAAATAAFVFMRSYGGIFGVSIPAAIFNARFAEMSYLITDSAVRQQLGNGEAYAFTTAALVDSFAPETQNQVREVFSMALRRSWLVSIAFAGIGLLLVFMEKEIPLRTTLETEFGLDEGNKVADAETAKATDSSSADVPGVKTEKPAGKETM